VETISLPEMKQLRLDSINSRKRSTKEKQNKNKKETKQSGQNGNDKLEEKLPHRRHNTYIIKEVCLILRIYWFFIK
jgi:hypothetical protein